MLSYPTYRVHAPDGQLNVLQITDMHLLSPASTDNAEDHSDEKPNCRHCFEANLAQALAEDIRCDLILVTGDFIARRYLLLVLQVIMMSPTSRVTTCPLSNVS